MSYGAGQAGPGRGEPLAGADAAGGPPAETAPLTWLAEIVRPRREPVPWAQMIHAALAICVPLGAGLAAGVPAFGLLAATGGLLGSIVDRGGSYPVRIRRVACAGAGGGAVGLTLGALIHGRGWVTVVVLIAVAGVSALLSAVGETASVTGLQLLVYCSFGIGPLGALRPWWLTPLLFLAGVGWAVVLMVPGWLLHPHAAEQRRVADVYRALAAKLRAIGSSDFAAERRKVTTALNTAYDELLTARSMSGGRDEHLTRLMAALSQATLIAEASTALARSLSSGR